MAAESGLLLEVDFNYGGIAGDKGVVHLNAKQGDRSKLLPHIRSQLDAARVELRGGLLVTLVSYRADLDDEGNVCDMLVPAKILVDENGRWTAGYDPKAMSWIPSRF